jgi:hypothetical protein
MFSTMLCILRKADAATTVFDVSKPARPTTPEEEGIEFHPDSWERFERTVQKVIKAPPVHRTGKTTAGDRPRRKRRGRAADKTSG